MIKFDMINYATKGVFSFALYSAYDVFVEGRQFNGFSSRDGAAFALSIISAEWTADILSNMWDMNNGVAGFLTRPLLTGIIYMYLFNYFVRTEYNSDRDNTKTFIMGSVSELLLHYAANPIYALFGLRNMN